MSKSDLTKRIHARLLDMAKDITGILEKHGFPYSMAYGTLLGAVRHKGFIPWDEDFDLFLFSESFEEAKECLRNELKPEYFLEDRKSEPKYFHAWAHVKDLGTVVEHDTYLHDDAYTHKGLSIDLYLLTRIELCSLWAFLNGENLRYINRRKELGLITESDYEERLRKIERAEEDARQNPIKSRDIVYGNITMHQYKYLPFDLVYPLKKYQFEDTEFFGLYDADRFLTEIYGDYMRLPPIDQRAGGHKSVIFLG